MASNKWVIGLIMAGAVGSACAESGEAAGGVVGKVGAVYVRESGGLYIEKKLLRKTDNKEIWAEIRFAKAGPQDANSGMYQLPQEATIERGDLVMAKSGGDGWDRSLNLIVEPNKVTQLVAKRDTLMAMTFELPNYGQSHVALASAFLK